MATTADLRATAFALQTRAALASAFTSAASDAMRDAILSLPVQARRAHVEALQATMADALTAHVAAGEVAKATAHALSVVGRDASADALPCPGIRTLAGVGSGLIRARQALDAL